MRMCARVQEFLFFLRSQKTGFLSEISQFVKISSRWIFIHPVGQAPCPRQCSAAGWGNPLGSVSAAFSLFTSPAWNPSLLRAHQLSAQIPGRRPDASEGVPEVSAGRADAGVHLVCAVGHLLGLIRISLVRLRDLLPCHPTLRSSASDVRLLSGH